MARHLRRVPLACGDPNRRAPATDGRCTTSSFWQRRWPAVAGGALLVAVLVFLGVHTALTVGGGNGLDQGHWVLVSADPTSSSVEILAIEGGCHRFDHLGVHYGHQTIAITTWDKVAHGACPADLRYQQLTASLPGPIQDRQVVGACLVAADVSCANAHEFASSLPSTPPS